MESPPRGYHWIRREISKLNPEQDYETIWRMSTSYRLNDFMNNLIYSLTFPNFIVTAHGSRAVWREDGGKVLNRATSRVEETETNNVIWWYYGPSDARCLKSIEKINNLHARWAKTFPGDFSHNDDYIYTLAFSAVLMHRLRKRLHLPGFSDIEKTAAHHFWRDMSYHFVAEGQVALEGYPEDWDGLIQFCEDFENMPREGTERGHLIAEAIYSQFAFRYFPPSLRWLGRAFPVALSLPTTLRTLKVRPVHPVLEAAIVFLVGLFMWLGETVMPDPKVSFCTSLETMTRDQQQARQANIARSDKAFVSHFAKLHANQWPGCPYHLALKAFLVDSEVMEDKL